MTCGVFNQEPVSCFYAQPVVYMFLRCTWSLSPSQRVLSCIAETFEKCSLVGTRTVSAAAAKSVAAALTSGVGAGSLTLVVAGTAAGTLVAETGAAAAQTGGQAGQVAGTTQPSGVLALPVGTGTGRVVVAVV